jgi:hypothetical protein
VHTGGVQQQPAFNGQHPGGEHHSLTDQRGGQIAAVFSRMYDQGV